MRFATNWSLLAGGLMLVASTVWAQDGVIKADVKAGGADVKAGVQVNPDREIDRNRIGDVERNRDNERPYNNAIERHDRDGDREVTVRHGDDNQWRYKFHNGRWWYWMPDNRWVIYFDNGWQDYRPGMSFGTTYYYNDGYSYNNYPYYSGYRYSNGYPYGYRYGYRDGYRYGNYPGERYYYNDRYNGRRGGAEIATPFGGIRFR